MRLHTKVLVFGALVVAASCGGSGYSTGPGTGAGGGGGGTVGSTSNSITVANNSFSPSATTVAVGTTVTWTWAQGSVTHNVTFSDGTASADMSSGTYSRTFNTAGTYSYTCTIHGSAMSGTITVK